MSGTVPKFFVLSPVPYRRCFCPGKIAIGLFLFPGLLQSSLGTEISERPRAATIEYHDYAATRLTCCKWPSWGLYLYTCSKEAKEGMPFVEGGVSRYSEAVMWCMLWSSDFSISHGVWHDFGMHVNAKWWRIVIIMTLCSVIISMYGVVIMFSDRCSVSTKCRSLKLLLKTWQLWQKLRRWTCTYPFSFLEMWRTFFVDLQAVEAAAHSAIILDS